MASQKREKNTTGQNRRQMVVANREGVVMIPRALGWAPSRLRATLRFNSFTVIKNVGFQYSNIRYTPTFAYDVDPLIGSTAMPGFTEWSAIYRQYRTISSKIDVHFSSLETFPTEAIVCPLNYDPTANVNPGVFIYANLLSRKKSLGPLTGNGVGTISHEMTTEHIGGTKWLGVADDYSAATSGGSPTNNWFWFIGTFGTSNGVSGVAASVDVDITLEFYEVTSPAA